MKYKNPRIKPIYPMYQMDPDTFRIGAQIGITKEFKDPTHQLWNLSKLLNGQSINKVLEKEQKLFPQVHMTDQYILDGVALLDKEGFIEETFPDKEKSVNERYKPNIKYFSHFIDSSGNRFKLQEKINSTKILLLGLGGGGSNILTLLAGLGPKKIIIIDYDTVEEENLGRQFLYKEKDIGKKKTEVAKKAINEINSHIEIESHNIKVTSAHDIESYIKDSDVVVCAIDEPQFLITRIVNQAIVKCNKPCVFAGSQVSHGRVFTVIPGITGCFDCLNIHYSLTDKGFVKQFKAMAESKFHAASIAYGPAIFQLTSVIVDEVVRVLTNYLPPNTLSTQFEVDYPNVTSFKHPAWPRYEEECPTCGQGTESKWEVFKYYPLFGR